MTSKDIVKAAQTNKNAWYKGGARGVVGPVLPRPVKK